LFSIIYDMSRGIVSVKPFSHKRRKQSIKKILNRSGISIPEIKINPKLKNILSRSMLFIVIVVLWILILIKNLFFQPEQRIIKVKFSEDTLSTYQDIELFNLISNEVKWKNYYILSSHKDELLTKIQKSFPFVWDIQLQLEPKQEIIPAEPEILTIWIQLPLELPITAYQTVETIFPLKLSKTEEEIWWTLWVQLLYYEPKILVKLNDKEFAVWDENTHVELKEWMLLWIRDPEEEPLFLIETPMYLSGTTNIDWFFFEISLSDFLQITALAKESFPDMKRFVYLAWSTRIAIFTPDDKTLYFNFIPWSSIEDQRNTQIFKYKTLQEKYPNFSNIWTIDLWALEDDKVIIKY
jgi:hypothetical protein